MSQRIPTGGTGLVLKLSIDEYKNESPKGLILEVDVEYPQELYDDHNSYPLAPEKLLVRDSFLSPYSAGIKEKFNISSG